MVETKQGLVLVDAGLGMQDYSNPTWFTQLFRIVTEMPFDPQEAAINQVKKLGFQPEDVRHIILTHMHFDHCGGLPDFPWATVHVQRREYQAFMQGPRNFKELAYLRRNVAKVKEWALYDAAGGKWYDFDAIRLPFGPEMWLVPLRGHSQGKAGWPLIRPRAGCSTSATPGSTWSATTPPLGHRRRPQPTLAAPARLCPFTPRN